MRLATSGTSKGTPALLHLDLEPRNIPADPDSAPDRSVITGFLDWDSAFLAPTFISCTLAT